MENRRIFPDSPTQPERHATTCAAHSRDEANLHMPTISKPGIAVNYPSEYARRVLRSQGAWLAPSLGASSIRNF